MPEPLSLQTELAIRNLYLYDGYTPQKIADELFLEKETVSRLITREGLAKIRKDAKALAVREHGTLATANALQAAQAIAAKSEQHALKALDLTGDALDAGNARDAQSFSSTARNLVGIARAIVPGGAPDAQQAGTVNLFFVQQVVRQEGEECLA